MRKCQKCGAEVEKDDSYCPDCGEKLAKETKKVTVWIILKIIMMLFLFIVFIQLLKNNPPIGIVFFVLTITWTGILNWVLKKFFNVEVSIGVKIIITAIVVVLLVSISQVSVQQIQRPQLKVMEEQAREFNFEQRELYSFVEKINQVIEARDYNSLEIMFKEGIISPEVFEGLLKLKFRSIKRKYISNI